MSTAAIVKACVILMGIGIMIVTFVLHAKKKLTVNLAVTWELLGIAAILSGAVPRFSGWSSRDRAWEPRCSSDHSASGSVGRLPDDNSDLFPVNEKPGTGDSGFSFEPGE